MDIHNNNVYDLCIEVIVCHTKFNDNCFKSFAFYCVRANHLKINSSLIGDSLNIDGNANCY